jgi:hypothetical protein
VTFALSYFLEISMSPQSTASLFSIQELSDVHVDACVRDASGSLLFMSCIGRDTAIQQLFAALSLPPGNGGLARLTLRDCTTKQVHTVAINNPDNLGKLSGRLPAESHFGSLVHVWIFDNVVRELDHANRSAWLLFDRAQSQVADDAVWNVAKELSVIPLLEHWRTFVVEEVLADAISDMNHTSYPPLGGLSARRVQLPSTFASSISKAVKSGALARESRDITTRALAA